MKKRFQDANLQLSDFSDKVLVVCPRCKKKATVIHQADKGAVLSCFECHHSSSKPLAVQDRNYSITTDYWFGEELWLQASFKDEVLWANNYEHLEYIRQYIQAGLRERNNRAFYTMVEKLPAFIKSAKNRDKLLKRIDKLMKK